VRLGGLLGEPLKRICSARRIIIAACGTSFHSGLVGEYVIEQVRPRMIRLLLYGSSNRRSSLFSLW
jgi:glucosamine 6-phosphate synthetase-like amidotransferase/phosphosugar isomerase protein